MESGMVFAKALGVEWDWGRRPPRIAPDLLSDQELAIYRALRGAGFLTGGQIERLLGPIPRSRLKKLLNRLVLSGVVHKHRLATRRAAIPFYSLGDYPAGWKALDEGAILKILTCNLIYTRLAGRPHLESWETRVKGPDYAAFCYRGISFWVAPWRDFPGELERLAGELGWLTEQKGILIAPNPAMMQQAGDYLEPRLPGILTYTWDGALLNKPLSQAFYFPTAEGMAPIHARLFDEVESLASTQVGPFDESAGRAPIPVRRFNKSEGDPAKKP